MKNITLLGTGAMGSRIGQRLLDSGYSVTIYNRTKNNAIALIGNGAKFSATPIEAVRDADVVISMLTNDDVSKSVWLDTETGAINGLQKGAIAIESSTVSINYINQLTNEFKSRNIDLLDAPVVGSRPQAEKGELLFLVGGNGLVLAKVNPLLSKLSSSIFHLGENAAGIKMKLAVNAFFGIQVSALSELIGMMQKVGVAKEKTVELFNHLPVTSPALKGIGNLIAASNYNPLFPIALVEKDFSYIIAAAKSCASELPVTKSAHVTYQNAIANKLGDDNIAGVMQLY